MSFILILIIFGYDYMEHMSDWFSLLFLSLSRFWIVYIDV